MAATKDRIKALENIEIPASFRQLYQPARYKAFPGGRGSGKSWGVAQYIIVTGLQRRRQIMAGRHLRADVSMTVKRTLEGAIRRLGLWGIYEPGRDWINCPYNGTRIDYVGPGDRPDALKSAEDYDLIWIDEANELTQLAIDIIDPTMRRDDAELIFSWNRFATSDPIDNMFFGGEESVDSDKLTKAFIEHAPAGSRYAFTTYMDNPWCTDVIRNRALEMREKHPSKYHWIYGGQPITNLEALVFPDYQIKDMDKLVPEDSVPRLGADWGFTDPACIVECHIIGDVLYIKHEAWKRGCSIDELPSLFYGTDQSDQKRWYNINNHKGIKTVRDGYKIIADSSKPDMIRYLKDRKFNIVAAKKGSGSVAEGIEFVRGYNIVIHPRCENVIDEIKCYRYKEDKKTGDILPELEDKNNHTIDSIRYAVESVRRGGRATVSYGVTGSSF